MAEHNGWPCSPDHFMLVCERQLLPTSWYYFFECFTCGHISKRFTSRKKANEAKRKHNDDVRKFDFGFGATNRDLERGLRALARSGYTKKQCVDALNAPWPHYIDHDCSIYDVKGIGQQTVDALLAWVPRADITHVSDPGHKTAEKTCAQNGCDESYQEHRWGAIKAHDAGWFTQKDGTAWCPQHVPDWVPAWRERQRLRAIRT